MGGGDTGAPSDYSETTAELIDDEVDRIVRQCYARAVAIMTEHRATLDRIAQELRKNETIDARQLRDILQETGVKPAPEAELPKGVPVEVVPPPPTGPLPHEDQI
jgi:cell division protease FtsH